VLIDIVNVSGTVWVLESMVLVFFGSDSVLIASTNLSNSSFATLYPSTRPVSIPLSIPSLTLSDIFSSKLPNKESLPLLYPSSNALSQSSIRFSPSGFVAASLRK
jgi:hypothetical protein